MKRIVLSIGLIFVLLQGISQKSTDTVFLIKKTSFHKKFVPKQGAEIGFFLPVNFFTGNFNSENVLIGADALILLPKIEPNIGWGAVFGIMANKLIWEVYCNISDHTIKFNLDSLHYTSKARFSMVGMNIDFKFLNLNHFHPYILIGIGLGSIYMDDIAIKVDPSGDFKINDAEFFNCMFNLGLGCTYYLLPRLGLRTDIYYRFYRFGEVSLKPGGSYKIEDKINAGAFNFSFTLFFTFLGFRK